MARKQQGSLDGRNEQEGEAAPRGEITTSRSQSPAVPPWDHSLRISPASGLAFSQRRRGGVLGRDGRSPAVDLATRPLSTATSP